MFPSDGGLETWLVFDEGFELPCIEETDDGAESTHGQSASRSAGVFCSSPRSRSRSFARSVAGPRRETPSVV